MMWSGWRRVAAIVLLLSGFLGCALPSSSQTPPLTAEAAAGRIVAAAARRPRLLFIGRTARQAWWLSRVAPGLYERIMARRLAAEMDRP